MNDVARARRTRIRLLLAELDQAMSRVSETALAWGQETASSNPIEREAHRDALGRYYNLRGQLDAELRKAGVLL